MCIRDRLSPTGQDLVKYRLWQEQDGVCAYSQNAAQHHHADIASPRTIFGSTGEKEADNPCLLYTSDVYKRQDISIKNNMKIQKLMKMQFRKLFIVAFGVTLFACSSKQQTGFGGVVIAGEINGNYITFPCVIIKYCISL